MSSTLLFDNKAKKRKSFIDDDIEQTFFKKNQDIWKQLSDVSSEKKLVEERLKNEIVSKEYLQLKITHFTDNNAKIIKQSLSLHKTINSLKSQRLAFIIFTCLHLSFRYFHFVKPLVCHF